MSEETIVAVFDSVTHAQTAVSALRDAGIPEAAISQHAGSDMGTTHSSGPRGEGFWSGLFGGTPDHDTAVYDRSMEDGSVVVTVKVAQTRVTEVADILERFDPIDLDERSTRYGLTEASVVPPVAMPPSTSPYAMQGSRADGGETLELAEERLAVGKRAINRGGTRIRRFVVETPVEEHVTLHDEKVTLERRPVTDGAAVSTADFSDKTIEMMETTEEAVVAKTTHVTEQIALRKDTTERVETIRDTVRRQDVEIEKIPGEKITEQSAIGTPVHPAKV